MMTEKNIKPDNNSRRETGFIDTFWDGLTLIAGYPFAFVLLLTSSSPRGFMADLKGEPGRQLAREWGEAIIVAFIMAMIIRTFLFQPFKIPSGSMRMTLIEGDRLFVNKLRYGPLVPFTQYRLPGFEKPRRGDIIVFRYPVTRDKDFIKRLIAFGGETVEIRDGHIFINDKIINTFPLNSIQYMNAGDYGKAGQKVVVPKGYYFAMGDNSRSSFDGRYWGFIPEGLVIGKAECLFWPLNRIRWIK
jgi:signal peptidase I